jgi:hypothetical protein
MQEKIDQATIHEIFDWRFCNENGILGGGK